MPELARPAPPARPAARAALLARLAVAGRGDERGPDALGRARPQQLRVGGGRACTRTRGRPAPSGSSSIDRHRLHAEHLLALQVGAEHPRPRSRRPAGCAATRSRTCPGWVDAPATTTPRGSNSARNCSAGPGAHRRIGLHERQLDQRIDGDRLPSTTMSGFRSTEAMSARAVGQRRQAHQDVDQALAVDRRLAAERPEQRLAWRGRRSCPRRPPAERHGAEHHVADGLGQDAAHSAA